jgi:hypothetical protein
MTTRMTTQITPSRNIESIGSPANQKAPYAPQRSRSLIAWVTLIGIFSPPTLISLGVINVTPGRFVVILLFLPALGALLRSGRKGVSSDFFVVALCVWMLGSSAVNGGFRAYVGAEALEFLGAYLIGRAFFYDPSNLRTFVKALSKITVVIIALALLDTLSGRHITLDSFGITNSLSQSIVSNNFRFGLVRAASVLDSAEHYGTFCVAAASIFFYSERGTRRILYVGLSFLGCALSLSSGPLMGLGIVIALFSYDRILKRHPFRWKILIAAIAGFILTIFLISDNPIEWILVHIALDPQTGFFRIATWHFALPLIGQSPFVGVGLVALGDSENAKFYLASVDCVWLVEALRYGLPSVFFLILAMFLPILQRVKTSAFDPDVYNVRTGFSLAISAMGIIGLTVHFWNGTWLFLSLCIGIRASIAECDGKRSSGRQKIRLKKTAYGREGFSDFAGYRPWPPQQPGIERRAGSRLG